MLYQNKMTEPVETEDKYLTEPSILRLARKAGIKNFSDPCYEVVEKLIEEDLREIIKVIKIINSEKDTKTIMIANVYQALNLRGERVAHSDKLDPQTTKKA